MFLAMGAVAWLVYKKFGLTVLRQNWINFDLLWAIALFLAGGIALILFFEKKLVVMKNEPEKSPAGR